MATPRQSADPGGVSRAYPHRFLVQSFLKNQASKSHVTTITGRLLCRLADQQRFAASLALPQIWVLTLAPLGPLDSIESSFP